MNLYYYGNWDICFCFLFTLVMVCLHADFPSFLFLSSSLFVCLTSRLLLSLCLNEECASNPEQERVHLEWASQTSLRSINTIKALVCVSPTCQLNLQTTDVLCQAHSSIQFCFVFFLVSFSFVLSTYLNFCLVDWGLIYRK